MDLDRPVGSQLIDPDRKQNNFRLKQLPRNKRVLNASLANNPVLRASAFRKFPPGDPPKDKPQPMVNPLLD
ncbi:MAG: hypothetical protein JXR00_04295 [Sulfitobacter geojensis]